MTFPVTTERFVAYFDIMEFKDRMYRSTHEDVKKLMDEISGYVNNIKTWESEYLDKPDNSHKEDIEKGIVLPVMFSDSVLMVSRTNSNHDAIKTVFLATSFLYNMFKFAIPVKGALAFGNFTADFKKSSFFGRPLIDAYLLAEDTHFYGALLHHTFEERLYERKTKLSEHALVTKEVPLKDGMVTHSFMNWVPFCDCEGTIGLSDILDNFYRKVSGSSRRYVDNTKKVYATDGS